MGLRLKRASREGQPERVEAVYELNHSGERTTLTLDVVVTVDDGGFRAGMAFVSSAAPTSDEALDALAEWLERSAAAIRQREVGDGVRWLPL